MKIITTKQIVRTDTVTENFNVPIVHFTHSLHLNMIAVNVFQSLPVNICSKIFSHVLRKIVSVGSLK